MPCSPRLLALLLLALPLACVADPIEDYGTICVDSELVDDEWVLHVEASSADCSSDHSGAEFSCSVTEDAETGEVVVSTLYQPGKDPNDACADPRLAVCELAVGAEPGSASLRFADEVREITFPGTPVCFD
jgi:hypothetical protein